MLAALMVALVGTAHAADWNYVSEIDKMTDELLANAVFISGNSLSLQPPDDGENHAVLMIRQRGANEPEVLLIIPKGRIICDPPTVCFLKARFDADKSAWIPAEHPFDGKQNGLFAIMPRLFIESAKKAKSILIQVTMQKAGEQVLEFHGSAPLKWDLPPIQRKGKAKRPAALSVLGKL